MGAAEMDGGIIQSGAILPYSYNGEKAFVNGQVSQGRMTRIA